MKTLYKILILTMVVAVSSCEVLDVEPSQSIAAEDAIQNKTDLERALMGCYDALQQTGMTRSYIIIGGLAADNLVWTGTTQDYGQVANNSITADNALVEDIWNSAYDGINRVNNVLHQLPGVPDLTTEEMDNYSGQLRFIRGFLHFNLVRLYGAVPIKTEPSLNTENLGAARQPVTDVYTQVIEDLTDAENMITEAGNSGFASKGAASALLARAYLYKEDWQAAKEKATEVIEDFDYTIDPDYNNLFSGAGSEEIIFEIDFNAQDRNRLAEYFFTRKLSGRKEISPDTLFVQAYDPEDARLTVSIADTTDGPYGYKYRDITGGTDNVIVLRLAEMYLIRAEANANLGAPVNDIRNDLGVIRERAGLDNVSAYSISQLLEAIEDERRFEFAFEAHRWFDLVRTGKAIEMVSSVTEEYQTLFPIPLSEIQTNDLIDDEDQNPGY